MNVSKTIVVICLICSLLSIIFSFLLLPYEYIRYINLILNMLIGIFSSSILTFVGALVSYFYRRNYIFFKVNRFIDNVYTTFICKIFIVDDNIIMRKANELLDLYNDYKRTITYFGEYKTFLKYGYYYTQIMQIQNLMINELNEVIVIILNGKDESVSDYYDRILRTYDLYEKNVKSKVSKLHKYYTEKNIRNLKRKKLLDRDFKMNYID